MIEISKVLEIGRSIFLPKEIAHKVANLEVSILQSVEFDSNKHLRVCSLSGKDEMFGVINQKVTTFKDFTQTWEELIASVEGWIKSNVSNPIELNLRKVHASR